MPQSSKYLHVLTNIPPCSPIKQIFTHLTCVPLFSPTKQILTHLTNVSPYSPIEQILTRLPSVPPCAPIEQILTHLTNIPAYAPIKQILTCLTNVPPYGPKLTNLNSCIFLIQIPHPISFQILMTKKHPKIWIHQTLASQTYHHLKNAQGHCAVPQGKRPNQTAHLRGTQKQTTHFATHLGNMPPPLKLLQQQNNVLHQQVKAKVQGTHNILTTNIISTLHEIKMV